MFKEFGATRAVSDVSVIVRSGKVLGIVGENGSGKSTLSSMIAGVYPPTQGTMTFEGMPYHPRSVLEARKAGVQYLTQEQGTIDGMSVAENMFLGEEDRFSRWGGVNMRKLIRASRSVLDENGLERVDASRSITAYAFEDRKMIETARSVSHQPKILIIDETTTALSQKGRERIYQIIEQQRAKGTAVIVISHDLEEVQRLCDEVLVMRDGAYVTTLLGEDIAPATMRDKMIGRAVAGSYYRADFEPSPQEDVVLSVSNLSLEGSGGFSDISLHLYRGEILGIGGLTECGMHDLLKTIFGALRPSAGEVVLCPGGSRISSTAAAVKNKVAYIPKDRDKESLFQATSIKDNIVAASLAKLRKKLLISPRAETRLANERAALIEVKMRSIEQQVRDLSGGNKQKVVIAKWLANDSRIFVMDCPTRGIDVGVKAKIYRLMDEMKSHGVSILMVSEEMTELLGMADRIIAMRHGRINGEFVRSESLTESDIIQAII
jgi:ribose transport system ATP-binding protein